MGTGTPRSRATSPLQETSKDSPSIAPGLPAHVLVSRPDPAPAWRCTAAGASGSSSVSRARERIPSVRAGIREFAGEVATGGERFLPGGFEEPARETGPQVQVQPPPRGADEAGEVYLLMRSGVSGLTGRSPRPHFISSPPLIPPFHIDRRLTNSHSERSEAKRRRSGFPAGVKTP